MFQLYNIFSLTWLYPQHKQLISQVQTELQALFARAVVEHGVNEGHDGSFHAKVVSVRSGASVQLVHHALEAGALARILLEVHHCF